jgi:hypothetical protein
VASLDDDAVERANRIDMILEELRLNTEDLYELARQARERASHIRADTKNQRERVEEQRSSLSRRKRGRC